MLDTGAKLPKNVFRDIQRTLADKKYSDPFGTNQPDNLFHLVEQSPGCAIEYQVCFIKEQDHFGFVRISNFRQLLKQLGQ